MSALYLHVNHFLISIQPYFASYEQWRAFADPVLALLQALGGGR